MIGEPRDRSAYGLAIASLGLALAVLLAGVCWVATQHGDIAVLHERHCALEVSIHCRPEAWSVTIAKTSDISRSLLIVLAVLGGVFVGTLIPFPPSKAILSASDRRYETPIPWRAFAASAFLLVAGAALAGFAGECSIAWCAIGGGLIGLPIPSPAEVG